MAETSATAPHAAPMIHIRTADHIAPSPTTTTITSVPQTAEPPATPQVAPAQISQPVTTTTPTTLATPVTVAPVTPTTTVAPVTPTTTVAPVATAATATVAPQPPNVPEFVDASCSSDLLTIQGQMTSAQAGVTVQLLIANDAFLVTAQTDAAGDFDWTGTGPACAPDMNLFVGMFGVLTTTTTSCEVDCFESSVTDEPH
jgi:hypothetical protein